MLDILIYIYIYIYIKYILSWLLLIRQWLDGKSFNGADDVHGDVITLITLLWDLSTLCVMSHFQRVYI